MLSIDLIAPHIDSGNFKTPAHEGIQAICAHSGRPITRGCYIKDVASTKWTDWDSLRYGGDYVSVEFALCIAETMPSASTEGRFNSLRTYSYVCNKDALRILRLPDIIPTLFSPPEPPFIICLSEGGKKHTSFKAPVNYSLDEFQVQTDIGRFAFDRGVARQILADIKAMYSVIDPNDNQQRTWFTKEEIKTLKCAPSKINTFGIDAWLTIANRLQSHVNSLLFNFLIFAVQKS